VETEPGRSESAQLQAGADRTTTSGMEKSSLRRQLQASAGRRDAEQRARQSGVGVRPR
jgi:hypothetical protein